MDDKVIVSGMSNTELLSLYSTEPYGMMTIGRRWRAITSRWTAKSNNCIAASDELGRLRQLMLQVHCKKGGEQDGNNERRTQTTSSPSVR